MHVPGEHYLSNRVKRRTVAGVAVFLTVFFTAAFMLPDSPKELAMSQHNTTILSTKDVTVTSEPGEMLRFSYPGRTFDTALPQEWVDNVTARIGVNPVGHVVWLYPSGSIFGHPAPTDVEGMLLLGRIASTYWP